MKSRFFLAFSFVLFAITALSAQDIDKAWGISAGLYENKLNEIAISYGVSNRTLLLFFTNLKYETSNSDRDTRGSFYSTSTKKNNELSALIGTEIRGFFYPGRIAPFGGLRFSAGWQQLKNENSQNDWDKSKEFQINIGINYGAEFFITHSFSIYLNMTLLNYSLSRVMNELYQSNTGTTLEETIRRHKIHISQNPAIFVKLYF